MDNSKKGTIKAGLILILLLALSVGAGDSTLAKKKKKKEQKTDPYAEIVWPPPPQEPRIKLDQILSVRSDVEPTSKLKRSLLGAPSRSKYDRLAKPYAVAFDSTGRILVSDTGNASLVRFDRAGAQMDVFGTQGVVRLEVPLGLSVAADDRVFVADAQLKQVMCFDSDGNVLGTIGNRSDLVNPTDVAISPDGSRIYVADSKAHRIVVFDIDSGTKVNEFGTRGQGEGEFDHPTSLTFGPDSELFVVDQLNARVQVFDLAGGYLDEFGGLGTAYGSFVRPKDIAIDELGLIYVTDNAYNNLQLFDLDFTLLTFVGEGGETPGRFLGSSGVAVLGDEFAVVDQLGGRVQVFRFIVPKDQ